MKPPLVLYDQGDLMLFESAEDLERYVESTDIIGYRVFDSNGDIVHLTTTPSSSEVRNRMRIVRIAPVRGSTNIPRINAEQELEDLLRTFLMRITGKSHNQSVLTELLAELQAVIGFTR